jgi:hypothetical protein
MILDRIAMTKEKIEASREEKTEMILFIGCKNRDT